MVYVVFLCTLSVSHPEYHACSILHHGPHFPTTYYLNSDDCKKAAAPLNAAMGKPKGDRYARATCGRLWVAASMGKSLEPTRSRQRGSPDHSLLKRRSTAVPFAAICSEKGTHLFGHHKRQRPPQPPDRAIFRRAFAFSTSAISKPTCPPRRLWPEGSPARDPGLNARDAPSSEFSRGPWSSYRTRGHDEEGH